MPERPPCLAVLGPTCAWKSDTALLLAEELDGEILSCDSMQVYRGLDVGTAKPGPDMRARCPHHFIDLLEIGEPWDASRFVEQARPLLAEIRARGRLPVLAGGTGLYARALLYDFALLPAEPGLFAQVEQELAEPEGPEQLRRELLAAARKPSDAPPDTLRNPRRLARAVEVLRLTGSPPWELAPERPTKPSLPVRQFILLPTMAILRPRIEQRTGWMLDHGWIEEAECAIAAGLLHTPTARQALGYRDIAAYLRGEIPDRESLLQVLVGRTVQYARRQRTWFHHQHPGAELIEIDQPTTAVILRDNILARLRG
jgi:tRNA dimethylallyltransferase